MTDLDKDDATQRPVKKPAQATTQTWLVTGASSGIGLAICRLLVAQGHAVTGVGRRAVSHLPDDFPDIPYIAADIATQSGRDQVLAHLPGRLTHALMNAGTGHYRPLIDEDSAAIRSVIATNLLAPMALSAGLYPALREARGVLGLVGSVAYRGAVGMPVYAASKAGLDGFARSLRSEWHGRVDVRMIHPGPTATGMAERAGLRSALAQRFMLPVEDVARGILVAMQGPAAGGLSGLGRRRVSFGAVLCGRILTRAWRRASA
ncbi:MAG: SDR family NAD(P)-dependent oxidoreductase [Roseinatronobacter sp.]